MRCPTVDEGAPGLDRLERRVERRQAAMDVRDDNERLSGRDGRDLIRRAKDLGRSRSIPIADARFSEKVEGPELQPRQTQRARERTAGGAADGPPAGALGIAPSLRVGANARGALFARIQSLRLRASIRRLSVI